MVSMLLFANCSYCSFWSIYICQLIVQLAAHASYDSELVNNITISMHVLVEYIQIG